MVIRLIAHSGSTQGQAVAIRSSKFFIGRDTHCHLRPALPDLGGIHALIEQRQGRLFVRDFGAEGGTTVNDRTLHARESELFDGDRLRIGAMELEVLMGDRDRSEMPPTIEAAPEGWPYLDGPAPKVSRADRPSPPAGLDPKVVEAATAPAPAPAIAPAPAPAAGVGSRRPEGVAPLTYEVVGETLVVTLLWPDLNDESTVSPIRTELQALLERPLPRLVIVDLGNVEYLSSRAVGVLLAHYQALHRQGGAMRVCRARRHVGPVLEQMRLPMLVDMYPTYEEAARDAWD